MGKQATEMLKGTLEGIVLAILSGRATYGYEITAWLREKGFCDLAEGTVCALPSGSNSRALVDVEKVAAEKGPPPQGVLPRRQGGTSSKKSGGLETSSQNSSNSSAKEVTEPCPMSKRAASSRR